MPLLPALRRHLPVFSQVWRLALPVILSNLLQSLVNVVDIFMAGRLGSIEIAAVGMGNTVRLLVFVMVLAVTSGSMALAAQAKGADDEARLSFVARQSLSLTVLLALLLSVVGWGVAEPLLSFLNSDGDPRAVTIGSQYLQILFAGTLFLMGNFVINSLMQGAGDTVTPLYLSGAVNVLNIGFNYLLMFGPGPLPALGVPGAALGTLLARALGVAVGLAILYNGRNVIRLLPGSYFPDLRMFRDILSIGVPSGLQGVVRNSAQILVLRLVTSTAAGTYGAAALAIGIQVESLAFMPGLAISIAATSLVGQSLGAWRVGDAKRRGDASLLLGALVMSSIAVPIFLFAPFWVRLFDPSAHPLVVDAGTSYLRINALSHPMLAFAMVLNGALRGAGDTRPGLVGTVLGRWVVVVPVAWFLAFPLGWGIEGVWWALFLGTGVSALWVWLRWRSRAWVGVALRGSPLYREYLRPLPEDARQRFLEEVRAPLLSLQGVTERVDEMGVRYFVGGETVRVAFSEEDFTIPEGAHLLGRSSPDSAPLLAGD